MKQLLHFILALTAVVTIERARADENVVRVGELKAYPLSFALGGGVNYDLGRAEEIYFTTYDGKKTPPRTFKGTNGEPKGTDEFSIGSTNTEWLTDYFVQSEVNGKYKILEFGSLRLSFPLRDANSNNLPDIVDTEAPYRETGFGVRTVDWLAAGRTSVIPDNYHLRLERAAGQWRGQWMYGAGDEEVSGGYYETPMAQGQMNYYRDNTRNFLDFYFAFPFSYTAKTFYSAQDPDHLTIRGLTLTGNGLKTVRAPAFTLMRSGMDYWGMVRFSDGDPRTPVADYRSWMFVVRDLNDTDMDHIPNLSDRRGVTFTRQPVGKTLRLGASHTLSAAYKPNGKDPIGPVYPQWLLNGEPIMGANRLSHTVRGFSEQQVGNYQLRLSTAAGEFLSNSARLQF